MSRHSVHAVLAVLSLAAGCGASTSSRTAPSAVTGATSVTAASFGGTWTSPPTASGSGGGVVPEGCSQFDYTVNPAEDGRSASLSLDATCVGIAVTATGQGTMVSGTLSWGASGTASKGSLTCPFSFENGTATLEGSGVRVTYAGTVCGVPVRGSQLLVRRG